MECKFFYFPLQKAIAPKIRNPELWFLCSVCRLILVKNHVKLHQEILNGYQVTERTRLECKFCYFLFQRAITPKIRNPELWFLWSARRLMLVNNPVKFHYLRYLKRLSSYRADTICDRRTDGRKTRAKIICLRPLKGNDVKMKSWHVCQFSNVILNKIRTEFLSFS